MRTTLRFAVLTIILLLARSVYAAPGDADAVLQQCGTPQSDTMVPGAGLHPNPHRVLTYQGIELHFDRDPQGWIFLYADHGKQKNLTRSATETLLPCFAKAMYSVESHAPLKIVEKPAAPPPTLQQRISSAVNLLSPTLIAVLIVLYFLPILLGLVRRPLNFVRLVLVNILLGWTIIGWFIALRMVFSNRRRFVRDESAVWPPVKDRRNPVVIPTPPPEVPSDDGNLLIRPRHPEPEPIPGEVPIKIPTPKNRATDRQPDRQPTSHDTGVHSVVRSEGAARQSGSYGTSSSDSGSRTRISRSHSAVTLPLESSKSGSMGYSSNPPKLVAPSSGIEWVEHYKPERQCRIEVLNDSSALTLYEITMTCRGVDGNGREYLGGLVAESFCVFPSDQVMRIVDNPA